MDSSDTSSPTSDECMTMYFDHEGDPGSLARNRLKVSDVSSYLLSDK
jgi:hypothetical protein